MLPQRVFSTFCEALRSRRADMHPDDKARTDDAMLRHRSGPLGSPQITRIAVLGPLPPQTEEDLLR